MGARELGSGQGLAHRETTTGVASNPTPPSNPPNPPNSHYPIDHPRGGYDEINLNCGCPSPKVATKRCFGARLMLEPEKVRRIVYGMARQVSRTELTVKCRIGADDRDSYPELLEFVDAVRAGGVRHLVVVRFFGGAAAEGSR